MPEDDDEISLDFGKIFRRKKKKEPEKLIEPQPAQENSEDIASVETEITKNQIEEKEVEKQAEDIEVKEKKPLFKKIFKEKKEKIEPLKQEEISFDWRKTGIFFKKYSIIFLILIPIILSIYFRAMPAYLPVTDDWAADTVYNFYRNQIRGEINQQYPNLPDANKNTLVESQFQQTLKEQKSVVQQQIKQLSQQYKDQFQDDTGQTYLLAIDPYYYLRHATHYVENGHAGTTIVGGGNAEQWVDLQYRYPNVDFSKKMSWDGQRMAPFGSPAGMSFHSYTIVFFYTIFHFFNKTTTLMQTSFLIPILFSALAVVPGFFIAKKIAGNIGGLFAGIIIAVNAFFISRTAGGFSDTDAYNVFFPLLITWIFLEAFDAKNIKKKLGLTALAGFFMGVFAYAWSGWWYVFDILVAAMGIYLLYVLISENGNLIKRIKSKRFRNYLIIFIMFIIFSGIFVSLFAGPNAISSMIYGPIRRIQLKAVAQTTLWPNVQTTVAELNPASLRQVISSVGGQLIFFLGIVGIILTAVKKDESGKTDVKYASLLIIWFIVTIYACTKGTRFILLFVPAFAIAFGVFAGVVYQYLNKWLSRELKINELISKTILIILLALLLISPIKAGYQTAYREVPSMNDAWWNSLTYIKENSSEDAVINSWWDFGHWFITIADRRVTFDGAGNDRYMAYWVGRSLYTDNEDLAVGILRMVDCGNNNAFWALDKILNDSPKSIDILNKIIMQDRKTAKKTLARYIDEEQIDSVLKYTHCDAPDNYYITSDDMIGKSGVWAHFGSWDFEGSAMYNKVYKKSYDKGIDILIKEFNLSEEEADKIYYEIQTEDPNQWISGWPSYASGLAGCNEKDDIIKCGTGLQVNLSNYDAVILTQQGAAIPKSLVYIDENNKFTEKKFNNSNIPYSAALIPTEDGNYQSILMQPELAKSMFTRLFFFKGHGLKHFKPFHHERQVTGGDIYVWKVDWEGEEELRVFDIEKYVGEEEEVEEIEEETNVSETDEEEVNASE